MAVFRIHGRALRDLSSINTQVLSDSDCTAPQRFIQIDVAEVEKAHPEDDYSLHSADVVSPHKICSVQTEEGGRIPGHC